MNARKTLVALMAVSAAAATLGLSGCASCARMSKSLSSDLDGGLERTVTLYDYQGDKLGEWSGKFDISEDNNEIYFDGADGKRVIIHGGIVVCEEN